MVLIRNLDLDSRFPETAKAAEEPNGLLAVGGDLSVRRLLQAYRRGIFPWYEPPQALLWWSPDPRMALYPAELRVSRSLRKFLRRSDYRVTADQAFRRVLEECAAPRRHPPRGTWLTAEMIRAYEALHHAGYAHSIEVWDGGGELAGGLYGVALGRVFFGESMFSRKDNGSKIALLALARRLRRRGYWLIDCQVESPHLYSLGARAIPREHFERYLGAFSWDWGNPGKWRMELSPDDLLAAAQRQSASLKSSPPPAKLRAAPLFRWLPCRSRIGVNGGGAIPTPPRANRAPPTPPRRLIRRAGLALQSFFRHNALFEPPQRTLRACLRKIKSKWKAR